MEESRSGTVAQSQETSMFATEDEENALSETRVSGNVAGKTIILITHSVEEALLLGERLYVMAPRPGRIHKEYNLPFASMGLKEDLRDIKKNKDFSTKKLFQMHLVVSIIL